MNMTRVNPKPHLTPPTVTAQEAHDMRDRFIRANPYAHEQTRHQRLNTTQRQIKHENHQDDTGPVNSIEKRKKATC